MNWQGLLAGIGCLGVATWLFLKAFRKHKKIDTCANAYVERVQDLGPISGKKSYAITYKVNANEPFHVLISPCFKAYDIGKKRMMYFEKGNAKENHYFTRFGINYDRRFSPAIVFIVFAVVFICGAFSGVF